jgi:3-oxoacyl-ACP reductase-like protein
MTREQIDAILGPALAAKAARMGDVYNLIRAGAADQAVGTLMAGQSHKQIVRERKRVMRALAASAIDERSPR